MSHRHLSLFLLFIPSAKHEGTLQEAALPNTKSSLLAPELR
jgi:hypothetical protein